MAQRTLHPLTVILLFCAFEANSVLISDTGALQYLTTYGYLPPIDPASESMIAADTMNTAISDFQSFMGMNVTGIIDEETSHKMSLPRCGVQDRVDRRTTSVRSKRFVTFGSRWKNNNLTYKIGSYPDGLSKRIVDQEISRAFSLWSEHTDLTFTKQEGEIDIEIRFEREWHDSQCQSFDGPSHNLAHAFFPLYGGDVHFDKDEDWTVDSYLGTNLFQVAVHEFGHSLGLRHSPVKTATMSPIYNGYDPNFALDVDDIEGIQAIYGPKTKNDDEVVPSCPDPMVDTIFQSADDLTYVFTGKWYWKLTSDGIAAGYPKLISTKWRDLPGNIDAAFTYFNGKTYFFKGSQYWRYIGTTMDGDYPKEISEGFPGIPDNVDAAAIWTGNEKIYFYKGDEFWQFDPAQRPPVRSRYPKPISNWKGLPNDLDAVVPINGRTYFFKGGHYYLFDDNAFEVAVTGLIFSRENKYRRFGCYLAT